MSAHPRALGVRDVGMRRDAVLRAIPAHGVPRRRLARIVVADAAGCPQCSLSDLAPGDLWAVWSWLSAVEDGRRRLVVDTDRVVILDDRGTRTIRWADIEEPTGTPPAAPSLFDVDLPPAAKVTDRGTQWAAARHVRRDKVKLGKQLRAVLLALYEYGENGACADALAAIVANLPNRVSSRVGDLRRLDLAEDTGREVVAQSGRRQSLWRLTAKGRDLARQEMGGEP